MSRTKAAPAADAPAGDDLVAVVLDHGGEIARVPEAEAGRLESAGEARRATPRDLAIAGQA